MGDTRSALPADEFWACPRTLRVERHSREKGLRVALLMEAAYESLADLRERAKAEVAKVVLGQDRAVELMLVAALARLPLRLDRRSEVSRLHRSELLDQ